MIMIVKTPGSQMGFPAAAEEGGEVMGGGRWEREERSKAHARCSLTLMAPKARSRSREVATREVAKELVIVRSFEFIHFLFS